MKSLAGLAAVLGLVFSCSGSDDGPGVPGGGAAGTGGAAGSAPASGGTGAAGSIGTGGGKNPNWCALQGQFVGQTEEALKTSTCNTIAKTSTYYNFTIAGTSVTMDQYIEKLPMSGTIDASCNLTVTQTNPSSREFKIQLDPAAMTGTGTYTFDFTSGCTVTYDLAITLRPGAM